MGRLSKTQNGSRNGHQGNSGVDVHELDDRLPPHSEEAELGVIGCILLDATRCLPATIEALGGSAGVFYDMRVQTMFSVLQDMADNGKAIDPVTFATELKERQMLDQCGGYDFIGRLPDYAPTAWNLEYWLPVVKDKHTLREMINTCQSAVSRAMEQPEDVQSLVDEIERDVLGIRSVTAAGYSSMKQLIPNALTTMETCHQRKGALQGLSTGFVDLDKMTGGLMNGDMIVIAARPSVGKTSLALNIAEYIAVELKKPVGVFSLEMSKESLALRALCSRARVSAADVREGFLAERDFPRIASAAGKLSSSPLFIVDCPGLTIMELRARARRLHQQEKVELIVVDYLQLLTATNHKGDQMDNREQEISRISKGLKAMARELGIPVIALSQLNRDMEKGKGRKPMLSDLRESGAIENDADVVGLMYRVEKDEHPDNSAQEVVLSVAKQRNGPTGDIHLLFLKNLTRFESSARVSNNDVPNS